MHKTVINSVFKKRIEEKISELEAKSQVEYVPVIVHRSSNYSFVRWELSWMTIAAALVVLRFVHFSTNAYWEISAAFSLGLVAFFVSGWEDLLHMVVPRKTKLKAVYDQAHRQFLAQEVFATQARIGILILVSVFEEAVYVLADKGFASTVTDAEWIKLSAKLAKDFNAKMPGESFLEALTLLNQRLAPLFPPISEHRAELPVRLRSPDET